ncbi:hypothetical protein [Acidovorax temperans]|uniref:hypothetical protein n=1 Tax=Acidovorax temperans TaxID=80878 RepID=UPI0030D5D930
MIKTVAGAPPSQNRYFTTQNQVQHRACCNAQRNISIKFDKYNLFDNFTFVFRATSPAYNPTEPLANGSPTQLRATKKHLGKYPGAFAV